MSASYREIQVPFAAGLNKQYEASLLPDGSVAALENWVPEETGGVRVRQGWKKTLSTGITSTIQSDIVFSNLGLSTTPDFGTGTDATSFASNSWTPPESGLIIATVYNRKTGGGVPPTIPTMSGNNISWFQITTVTIAAYRLTLFGANAASSSTGATTVDFSGVSQDFVHVNFMGATGVDLTSGAAGAFVQTPTGGATGTSASISLAAAADSANRAFAAFSMSVAKPMTPRASWLAGDEQTLFGSESFTEYRPDAFETTASATWDGTSQAWLGIAAELKRSIITVVPTSKGIGLGTYSKISIPQPRQRTVQKGSFAVGGTLTFNWSMATKAGSLLVLKIFLGESSDFTAVNLTLPRAAGYNLYHNMWKTAGASGYKNGVILFKENALAESSVALSITGFSSTTSYIIEGIELQQIPFGTPKNLMDGLSSNFEWFSGSASETGTSKHGAWWISTSGTGYFRTANTGGPGLLGDSNNSYYAVTSTGTNPVSFKYANNVGQDGIPIQPNTAYVFSAYLASSNGPGGDTSNIKINWYNSGGTLLSTIASSTVACAAGNTWERRSIAGTSPGTAAFATVEMNVVSGSASDYFDEAQFELGLTPTTWVCGGVSTSAFEKFNFGTDVSNPINLVSTGTTAASVTLAEATVCLFAQATPSTFSTWTNGYTENTDTSQSNASTDEVTVGSASKAFVSSGQSASVDVTETNLASTDWCLIVFPFTYTTVTPERWYMTANDNTSSLDVYYIDKETVDTASWNLLESLTLTPGGVPLDSATGLGVWFYSHPGMANPRTWAGQGTTPSAVSAVISGVCVDYFKTRFFVGGDTALASRLYYSDIGDVTSWPAMNFIDIGKDDGEKINDLASQQNLLIIGKASGIWTLSGSGPDTFFLSQLPYGEAAPGRSIAITPFGAIVAGKTGVWSVISSTVENISTKLGASYAPTGYVHTGYADGKVYILDVNAKTIYVYDLATQVWHTEKHDSLNNQPVTLMGEAGKRLLAQPVNSIDTGLLYYKDLPALTRDRDFAPVTAQTKLTSPVMHLSGPRTVTTPRYLFLQIRQRGSTSGKLILKTSYGESGFIEKELDLKPSSGSYRKRIDLGAKRGVDSVQFELEGPAAGNQYDIEQALLGFDEETLR